MKNLVHFMFLTLIAALTTSCGGGKEVDCGNDCEDYGNQNVVIEDKTLYWFEHGSGYTEGGIDYEVFWCDAWRFSGGVIYMSNRTVDHMTSCPYSTQPAGTYVINNGALEASFNGDVADGDSSIDIDILSNESPYELQFSAGAGADVESNRFYEQKAEVEALLSAQVFEVNDDFVYSDISITDTINLTIYFQDKSCSAINDKYDRFVLTGEHIHSDWAISQDLNPSGALSNEHYDDNGELFAVVLEVIGNDAYCAIQYDFSPDTIDVSEIEAGDKFYFVATAKHGLEDVKTLAIVPQE